MTVDLPPDIQTIIDHAIASGNCKDEADVVRKALKLYEQFEQRRDELRREIEKGVLSGDSIPGDDVFKQLEQLAGELATTSGPHQ